MEIGYIGQTPAAEGWSNCIQHDWAVPHDGSGALGMAYVCQGFSHGGALARRASFFDHSPPVPVFAPPPPPSPNNLEYLLTVSKNLAHPLHPVYDDGKGGGRKWWE